MIEFSCSTGDYRQVDIYLESELHMQEELMTLGLNEIVELENIPDRPLNTAHVDALVAKNEPDKWPPIIVTPLGNNRYGRIAGKHRIEAARKLQRNYIRASVRQYNTAADMYSEAWEDNTKNGLPLSIKQRKEYAVTLHQLQPSLSHRELGRRAGLTHDTVKDAIEDAEASQDEQAPRDKAIEKILKVSRSLTKACEAFRDLTWEEDVNDSAEILDATYKDTELEEREIMLEDMYRVFQYALKLVLKRKQELQRGA